jgi:hypothetical protein
MMEPDDAPGDGVQPLPQFVPPHVRDAFSPFPSTLVVDEVRGCGVVVEVLGCGVVEEVLGCGVVEEVLGCGVVEEVLGCGVVEEVLGEAEHAILSFVYSPT